MNLNVQESKCCIAKGEVRRGSKDIHVQCWKVCRRMEKWQTTWPGNIHLVSGDRYEGEWSDGTENGQGTFIWSDGDKYEGEFKDGETNGQGILTSPDGSQCGGDWRDNKPWNIIEFDNEQHIIGMWLNGIEE